MKTISVDNPGKLDTLGRVALARQLLDVAQRVEAEFSGAVIGLEAEWGAGKSHLLATLEVLTGEVPDDTRPILIRFNPWMVSGAHGLVEALLLQMSAELASRSPNLFRRVCLRVTGKYSKQEATKHITASLIRYASILGAMKNFAPAANMLYPGAGHLLHGVAHTSESAAKAFEKMIKKHTDEISITRARREVAELLRELERRIIVVVDDLDRLPPAELAAMVQAIKAVADFPNVIYILAFDPNQAARSLEEALKINDGQAYLEKVIQVPFPLPEIPASRLNAFALPRLKSVIQFDSAEPNHQADLLEALTIVVAVLATPRDVERLRTRLCIALPTLAEHISVADFLVLEALTIKAPLLIDWISKHVVEVIKPGLAAYDDQLVNVGLLGDRLRELEDDDTKEAKGRRAFAWESLLPAPPRSSLPLRNAMAFLFDACRPKWGGKPTRSNFRRVQQYRYWYRWRCYHDHHEQWPVGWIAQLVREPRRIIDAGWHHDQSIFRDLCQQICDLGADGLTEADSVGAATVFHHAEEALGPDLLTEYDAGYGPTHALVVLLRLDSSDHQVTAIDTLIALGSVWLAGLILVRTSRDHFPRPGDPVVPTERRMAGSRDSFLQLAAKWFVLADQHLAAWDSLYTTLTPYTLCSWMHLLQRDLELIHKVAMDFIGDDISKLESFFASFVDRPDDHFSLSLNWQLIPEPDRIAVLAERSPQFLQQHTKLMEIIQPLGLKTSRHRLLRLLRSVADLKQS